MSNYQITGVRLHHFPELIYGLAYVKKAAAIVNAGSACSATSPTRSRTRGDALTSSTEHHAHFAVDVIQAAPGRLRTCARTRSSRT